VPVAYALGLLLLAFADSPTVEAVVWVNLGAIVAVAVSRFAAPRPNIRATFPVAEIARLIRTGLRFHFVTILLAISLQIDRLAVISLFDDTSVGYYMVAWAIAAGGLGVVTASFNTVLFPQLASLRESRGDRAETLASGIRVAMLLLFVVATLLVVTGPPLIPFLFGSAFAPARSLVTMLVIALAVSSLREIVAYSIRGLGAVRPAAVSQSLALAVFAICLPPAVRIAGMRGVIACMIAGSIPSYVYLWRYLRREHGFKLRDVWGVGPSTARELAARVRHSRRM
jgi:O-antigen/teichoic acid export membrane protein